MPYFRDILPGIPVTISDTTNSQGTSDLFALADHVHSHGNRGGGSLHADATTLVSGFLSATDKVKLNSLSGTNSGDITLSGSQTFLTLVGQTLTLHNVNLSSEVSGTLQAAQFPALSGDIITSAGSLTTSYNNAVPVIKGGTYISIYAVGDMIYASGTTTLAKLAGNTSTTVKFMTSTGDGVNATAPAWQTIPYSSLPLKLYDENISSPTDAIATGTNAVAIGNGAEAGAENSLAIGKQSLTRHYGSIVESNGRFSNNGDSQAGRYFLRNRTIDAVFTELFLDGVGGSLRLDLPDDSTWTYRIMITGHRTDANDGHAGYMATGVIYRGSGAATVALQGVPTKTVISESNAPWDINIQADTSNGSLKITVKGQAGKVIRWLAVVDTVEITN